MDIRSQVLVKDFPSLGCFFELQRVLRDVLHLLNHLLGIIHRLFNQLCSLKPHLLLPALGFQLSLDHLRRFDSLAFLVPRSLGSLSLKSSAGPAEVQEAQIWLFITFHLFVD